MRERRDKQVDTDTAITLTYVLTDTKHEWVNRSDADRLTGCLIEIVKKRDSAMKLDLNAMTKENR